MQAQEQPKPEQIKELEYNGAKFTVKPYSIEMAMAYNDYIEPNRSAYLLNFSNKIDRAYLAKFTDRIDELKETIDSFDEDLNDEQAQSKAKFEAELKEAEQAYDNDAHAQEIRHLIETLEQNALRVALKDRNCTQPFFETVLSGDMAKLDYTGPDFIIFGLKVLTAFFLAYNAMLKDSAETSAGTAKS